MGLVTSIEKEVSSFVSCVDDTCTPPPCKRFFCCNEKSSIENLFVELWALAGTKAGCFMAAAVVKNKGEKDQTPNGSNRAKIDMIPILDLHKACASSSVSKACRILDSGLQSANTVDEKVRCVFLRFDVMR